MKRKFQSLMFGNYTHGEGINGLWILGLVGIAILLLQLRSQF